MEKLAFTLVTVARNLNPYFQAHIVVVLTDKPLRRVMSSPKVAGLIALWAIELSEFDIQYQLRTAIKGQVIADFIIKFTHVEGQGAEESPQWSIHTEGSSDRQIGGAGVVFHSSEGDKFECMIHLNFPTTNNEVEYQALITGLDLAKAVGVENLVIYCDSQVVTSQVNGNYE